MLAWSKWMQLGNSGDDRMGWQVQQRQSKTSEAGSSSGRPALTRFWPLFGVFWPDFYHDKPLSGSGYSLKLLFFLLSWSRDDGMMHYLRAIGKFRNIWGSNWALQWYQLMEPCLSCCFSWWNPQFLVEIPESHSQSQHIPCFLMVRLPIFVYFCWY